MGNPRGRPAFAATGAVDVASTPPPGRSSKAVREWWRAVTVHELHVATLLLHVEAEGQVLAERRDRIECLDLQWPETRHLIEAQCAESMRCG